MDENQRPTISSLEDATEVIDQMWSLLEYQRQQINDLKSRVTNITILVVHTTRTNLAGVPLSPSGNELGRTVRDIWDGIKDYLKFR